MRRLLLTGAAGALGRQLAADLVALAQELRLSDLPGLASAVNLPGRSAH